ncbi:J domain-containing protein [Pseudoxanthomonas dokdonensis]|uniref:J domain-containing protein n=1 Tax=Pseudoxanthomonas dokdonensis TaxID=344882 RepID=A0A0R0CGR8_9GAMM|nr:J domain-containing protein [Pseudoxanthomonas dokdonensis]KRG68959.1 hypothetical protein ABB29_10935 [Pseudoxanthomonas dokdonensis]
MEPDFSLLYRQLGVPPDCGLEQFKQAYRRQIAELHPDRHASADASTQAQALLPELIASYAAAIRFHKEHGRLPGASVNGSGGWKQQRSRRLGDRPAQTQAHPATWHRHVAIVGVLLLAGVYIVLSAPRDASPGRSPGGQPMPAHAAASPAPALIRMGMDKQSVRDIQGPPSYQREQVWEYGPSWVRFEDDAVVEWYDSPLYPLRVARTATPVQLQPH